MRLFSPNGLWFLVLIPIFVLMYILKQRYEEKQIPSLYLWQQVVMDMDATSPFQKLKQNILFFLQLLILLLCIFAMTNPFIWWKNNNYQNVVLVVDTSGSMSALGEKDIKLEEAKQKAEALINSLSSGTRITLISASKNFKVELSGSTEKKEIINKLEAISPTNSAGSIEDTYSLVKAICDQYQSYRVVYFTDHNMDLKGLNGEVVELGPERPNASLDYIAHTKKDSSLKVMVRVSNHSNESEEAEICLYGEEELLDIKNEVLKGGESKTIYFDNVPADCKYIYGELSNEDGLMEDNRIYSVVKQKEAKRVLLSTEQNVFLEKALNTLKDIELYKTNPDEKINEEFDLYIFDGDHQGQLPQKGNILFINPRKDNVYFKAGEELSGGKAAIASHAITKYMTNSDFVVSRVSSIDMPYWASPLITVNENNVSFAGELKGRKVAAIGFDLHNSDFPLTLEFPVFVNNLISYLMDRDTMSNTQYSCGDEIEINPLPETESVSVKGPDGVNTELSSKYPLKPYEKTSTTGIYEISQKAGDKQIEKLVAVNFPVSESGPAGIVDTVNSNETEEKNATEAQDKADSVVNNRGGFNLLNILLLTALIIAAVEWLVYVRQYRI